MSRTHRLRETLLKFYGWCHKTWYIRGGITIFLVSGPTGLLALAKYNDEFGPLPPFLAYVKAIEKSHHWIIWICIGFGVIFVILQEAHNRILFACERRGLPETRIFAAMIEVFDEVVGKKMMRFGEVAHAISTYKEEEKFERAFKTITQPRVQMHHLIEGIYKIISLDVPQPKELKITLAKMEHGLIAEYAYFLPSGNHPTPAAELRHLDSTFSTACRDERMVIVEDLKEEGKKEVDRKYRPAGPHDKGSLICLPVPHGPKVEYPYVISIKHPKPRVFTEAFRDRYNEILLPFAKRIAMEHSLLLIRGEG